MVWVYFFVLSVGVPDLIVSDVGFFNCPVRLESFSKIVKIFPFSDGSVTVVVLSVFGIVQINSRSDSVRSNGFMSSCSKVSIGKFSPMPLLSASTVKNRSCLLPDIVLLSVIFSCLSLFP